uniref:RING-type domain-containing protein n=1 Tax=Cucumis sativus TaxID=3659 RepID=A0A0A0KF27_CUCSA
MDSDRHRKIDYRYIADNFSSLDQVISALRHEGLESSNLILGIDFTKSNEWTGRYSFRRKSLHSVSSTPNPYEQAISIIGHTLSPFDDDGLIPCFGFGDASTCDQHVFSFYPDHRPCKGFKEALFRYREILPYLNLSGPTSFAPVIDAAIGIVEKSNWQYHVLVIIADGQVTRNPNTPPGKLSFQEQATINSIVAASHYPLSIILIGVGDGPWDAMHKFDDNLPQRAFDNFQFLLRGRYEMVLNIQSYGSIFSIFYVLHLMLRVIHKPLREKLHLMVVQIINYDNAVANQILENAKAEKHSSSSESVCPICLTNPKDMAFACGHTTCKDCGVTISTCPLCREPIKMRLRLYA